MASESKTSGKTRDTLRTVRQDLNTIVSRLEAADVTTQKSVKALETALRALANEGDKDTQNSQAKHDQLEEQIKALKARLTKMVRDTQIAVNADLKNVLADPRLATLAQAIDTANARLHNTEAAQEKTLSDIKKYIADLARTVDQNLDAERKAREDALAATQEKQENLQTDITACLEKIGMQSQTLNETTTRMTSIENDTAAALQHMGDKDTQNSQAKHDQLYIKTMLIEISKPFNPPMQRQNVTLIKT